MVMRVRRLFAITECLVGIDFENISLNGEVR